jgi:hypothetical protein
MGNMDIDMTRRNAAPRSLSDDERAMVEEYIDSIHYSARYVFLPRCTRQALCLGPARR